MVQGHPSVAGKAFHRPVGGEELSVVFLPHGCYKPLPARVAHDDVGQDPVPVPRDEIRG